MPSWIWVAVLAAMLPVLPSWAHHSFAKYDLQKTVTITGTVKEFQWTNPHSWMEVVVENAQGRSDTWSLEMSAVSVLARTGWKPDSVKPGDRITVLVRPLRDGSPGGSLVTATIGGQKLDVLGQGGLGRMAPVAEGKGAAEKSAGLNGVWEPIRTVTRISEDQPAPVRLRMEGGNIYGDDDNPILQKWASESVRKFNEATRAGKVVATSMQQCLPLGIPRIINIPYAFQILVSPDVVVFLHEYDHTVRFVYLNQKHPESLEPRWMGHSVGRWDGDTLIVDTVGFTDKTYIDSLGTPHTPQMRLTERFRLTDGGDLEMIYTVEDPAAFTTTWSGRSLYARTKKPVPEMVCAENNRGLSTAAAH